MEPPAGKVVAASVAAAAALLLLLVFLSMDLNSGTVVVRVFSADETGEGATNSSLPIIPRKLLQKGGDVRKRKVGRRPAKMGAEACSNEDIVVYTDPTPPLPNGVPSYTVEIINVCSSGCAVADVHLRCGWFASYRLVNPRLFRRLRHDDCLVNDGRPIPAGGSISFAYANSFSYELDVASLSCVRRT